MSTSITTGCDESSQKSQDQRQHHPHISVKYEKDPRTPWRVHFSQKRGLWITEVLDRLAREDYNPETTDYAYHWCVFADWLFCYQGAPALLHDLIHRFLPTEGDCQQGMALKSLLEAAFSDFNRLLDWLADEDVYRCDPFMRRIMQRKLDTRPPGPPLTESARLSLETWKFQHDGMINALEKTIASGEDPVYIKGLLAALRRHGQFLASAEEQRSKDHETSSDSGSGRGTTM